jgi:hypothetical protein
MLKIKDKLIEIVVKLIFKIKKPITKGLYEECYNMKPYAYKYESKMFGLRFINVHELDEEVFLVEKI